MRRRWREPAAIAVEIDRIRSLQIDALRRQWRLMSPTGGSIGNVPVLCSDGLPANTTVALDATQIAAATEALTFDVSRQATIVADTAPDSPPSASTVVTSLWAQDMIGSRLERYFGATRLRAGAVAAVNNVNYSGNSPA